MDKEAQAEIRDVLWLVELSACIYPNGSYPCEASEDDCDLCAMNRILSFILPKGKPPLLTGKKLDEVANDTPSGECLDFVYNAIKAQREVCIGWYEYSG